MEENIGSFSFSYTYSDIMEGFAVLEKAQKDPGTTPKTDLSHDWPRARPDHVKTSIKDLDEGPFRGESPPPSTRRRCLNFYKSMIRLSRSAHPTMR